MIDFKSGVEVGKIFGNNISINEQN
jgi:hypothetical protein